MTKFFGLKALYPENHKVTWEYLFEMIKKDFVSNEIYEKLVGISTYRAKVTIGKNGIVGSFPMGSQISSQSDTKQIITSIWERRKGRRSSQHLTKFLHELESNNGIFQGVKIEFTSF